MSYYKGGRGSGYRGGSGGYRGSRGGGGDNWRGSSRGGSFGSSSRGSRYSYPSPTYESRSRSSYGGSGGERYSRAREDTYHRYSQDVGYSTRDYGRALSPEPPRKRPRPDPSPTYLGPRRSHERSFTSDYSSGRNYYDKGGASSSGGGGGGGYLGDKPSYTREVRERGGNDFGSFRKPSGRGLGGGGGGGGGGYRGRNLRGGLRGGFRSTSFLRKRRDTSFPLRKRTGLTSRSEYLRRLKQLRLRRRLQSLRRQQKGSDDDDDLDLEDGDKDVDDDEEGSGDEEEEDEVAETSGEEEEEEGAENEENEEEQGEKEDGEGEATAKKEEDGGDETEKKEGENEGKKTEEKVVKKKVVKKVKKKVVKAKSDKEEKKTEGDEKDEEGKDKDENEEDSEKQPLTDFLGQPYIKLKCPHCHHVCVTYKEYSKHLDTRKHQISMQELFTKLRKILSGMRLEQRKKQRVLDEECKAKNMRLRTFFCSICKLNYRTLKSHHQASSSHRKMSEFLLPFCSVCRLWFKSAWSYESHLCELPHIKKKARLEKLSRPPTGKDDSLLADKEENDMLDTSSFMILDSVGSGDDSEGEKSDEAEEKEGEEKDEKSEKDSEKKKKKKSEIKLGAEHCKLVEVYYCELCKGYLPRLDDKERALTIHCRSTSHLQRYVRLNSKKNEESLRRKAVRLHKEKQQKLKEKEKKKKEEAAKEEESVASVETELKEEEEPESKQAEEETKETEEEKKEEEEKTWSEVDKDLSDLLHDGEDEEETPKERYDRFRKTGETEVNGTTPGSEK